VKKLPPQLPLLVLQGSKDKIINPSGTRFIQEHVLSQDKTINFTPGSGHLLLEVKVPKGEVLSAIDNWLGQKAALIAQRERLAKALMHRPVSF